MNELIAVLRDISTGALPAIELPDYLMWLLTRSKTTGRYEEAGGFEIPLME